MVSTVDCGLVPTVPTPEPVVTPDTRFLFGDRLCQMEAGIEGCICLGVCVSPVLCLYPSEFCTQDFGVCVRMTGTLCLYSL